MEVHQGHYTNAVFFGLYCHVLFMYVYKYGIVLYSKYMYFSYLVLGFQRGEIPTVNSY